MASIASIVNSNLSMLSINLCELPRDASYYLFQMEYTLLPPEAPISDTLKRQGSQTDIKPEGTRRIQGTVLTGLWWWWRSSSSTSAAAAALDLVWIGSGITWLRESTGMETMCFDGMGWLTPAKGRRGVSGCQTQSEAGYKSNVSRYIQGAERERCVQPCFFVGFFETWRPLLLGYKWPKVETQPWVGIYNHRIMIKLW